MRILAYFHPAQDPFVLRARLKAAGWHQVAMRDGSLWRADSRPESGWPAVHAPLYPGIARAYEATGVKISDQVAGDEFRLPAAPVEVDSLPAAPCYAVLNPGAHLLDELAAIPLPAGCQTIGVNEAARRIACDWQLCNDGFGDPKFQSAMGDPGRITRERFATTIPGGRWFNLGRIGIVDGTFSTTCGLRCSASAAPVVYLYGHDLVPGNGLERMTGHWDGPQLSNVEAEVRAEIARMRALGVRVVHVRWVDGAALLDDGAPAAAAETPAAPAAPDAAEAVPDIAPAKPKRCRRNA